MASQPGTSSGLPSGTPTGSLHVTGGQEMEGENDVVSIYFICQRKWDPEGRERCNAASKADGWIPKSDDPNARAQRWYCPVCGCRYKAAYGVLVEILLKGNTQRALYCKAEVMPDNMVHLMKLCALGRVRHVDDFHLSLGDAVQQSIRPQDRGNPLLLQDRDEFFTEVTPGVYTFSGGVGGLPTVHWYEIYHILNRERLDFHGWAASAPFP